MRIISADFLIPVAGEPSKDGAIVIDGQELTEIGSRADLENRHPEARREHFSGCVLMPGFVNCHAHLELTAMRGLLDEEDGDFRRWLLRLTKVRAESLTGEEIANFALLGTLEAAKAGVTCVADIGRQASAGIAALESAGLRGIVYQETEFAPDSRSASEEFKRLEDRVAALEEQASEKIAIGISPHSAYTVSRKLFEMIAESAGPAGRRVTIHAAESPAEDLFMKTGDDFFADVFKRQGVEWDPPGVSPIRFLQSTGILECGPLLAHCVTADKGDIELIASTGCGVAHCPKSNAKLGHGVAPFSEMLSSGIALGLGTDSVASNNACDMFEEARFAALLSRTRPGPREFHSASELLNVATLGGARALGLDDKIGSLEKGKQADLIVVYLGEPRHNPVNDPESAVVFASSASDVRLTVVAGRDVVREGVSTRIDESGVLRSAKSWSPVSN